MGLVEPLLRDGERGLVLLGRIRLHLRPRPAAGPTGAVELREDPLTMRAAIPEDRIPPALGDERFHRAERERLAVCLAGDIGPDTELFHEPLGRQALGGPQPGDLPALLGVAGLVVDDLGDRLRLLDVDRVGLEPTLANGHRP